MLKPLLATGALMQLARLVHLIRSFLGSALCGRRTVGAGTAIATFAGDDANHPGLTSLSQNLLL